MNNPENDKQIKETLEKLKGKSPEEISEIIKDNLQTDELSREDEISRRLLGGLPPRQPLDESFDFGLLLKKSDDGAADLKAEERRFRLDNWLSVEDFPPLPLPLSFPPPVVRYDPTEGKVFPTISHAAKASNEATDFLIRKLIEINRSEGYLFGAKSEIRFQEKDGEIVITDTSIVPLDFSFVWEDAPTADAMTYADASDYGAEESSSWDTIKATLDKIKADIAEDIKSRAVCAGLGLSCGRAASWVFVAKLPDPPIRFVPCGAPDLREVRSVEIYLCDDCAGHVKGDSPRACSIGFKSPFSEDELKRAEVGKIVSLLRARIAKMEAAVGATYDALRDAPEAVLSYAERLAALADMSTEEIEAKSVCQKLARRTARKGRKGKR